MADTMIPRGQTRATSKAIFVDYCPKDILDDTTTLDPWEELAYRRLLDLAVVTGDELPDDDKRLAWMTKTGRRWKGVKAALIAAGKIEVSEGKIRVAEAVVLLQKTERKMAQKTAAGRASAERRKPLENNETEATDVGVAVPTAEATTHLPTNPLTHSKGKVEKERRSGRRPNGQRPGNDGLPLPSDDAATWEAMIRGFDPDKPWSWPSLRGPRPDEKGCYAPAELLAKYGYRKAPEAQVACHG